MEKFIILTALLLASCSSQPNFKGPASLQIVPPGYYSRYPPVSRPVIESRKEITPPIKEEQKAEPKEVKPKQPTKEEINEKINALQNELRTLQLQLIGER